MYCRFNIDNIFFFLLLRNHQNNNLLINVKMNHICLTIIYTSNIYLHEHLQDTVCNYNNDETMTMKMMKSMKIM